MKKNYFALFMIIALVLVMGLSSCAKKAETTTTTAAAETTAAPAATEKAAEPAPAPAPEPEPVKELTIDEKLTADVWCYGFSAEGYGDYNFIFHFYDEDPTLGKIYYAGFSNNRQNFAGKYNLIEREYAYKVYKDRAASEAKADMIEGTAPYTIVLYDFEGNVTGSMGFDGEKVINAQDKEKAIIYATGSTPYFYEKNTGKFDSAVDGEVPMPVYSFVADEDVTSTVQVNHNHTYTDLVAAMIEGTWEATAQADGSTSFAFTPNDKTDTPATLVVAADKKTAVYTAQGENPIKMSVPQPTVTVVQSFEGKAPTSYGKDATITLDCLSDDTFTVTASIFGQSMEIDKGTWTVNHAHKYTFVCEKAGTIESAIVERSVQFTYAQNGTKLGDISCTMKNK
ncbi:MAG: hypothetical protein K5634_03370 [Sphaerochaetaceae bacterium]|nr:hypothetical protein [Sphaerochaetaceae bacterium]